MKTATITEIKNGLSAVIDRVRAGETVVVTDRGIPVARIEPVHGHAVPGARRARLERAGLLRTGTRPLPAAFVGTRRPTLAPGASAVQAVLDERRESR
jgi:prevent-host-death family protein